MLIGDNLGFINLFDTSRKIILDKMQLFEGRRILSISNCTIVWCDTKLTYVSVTARGSPEVKILIFKHNESKMRLLYKINVCPHLPNPDSLETNPDQSYLELPAETKLSLDGLFLTVISFGGEVKLLKMPPILNPLKEE